MKEIDKNNIIGFIVLAIALIVSTYLFTYKKYSNATAIFLSIVILVAVGITSYIMIRK